MNSVGRIESKSHSPRATVRRAAHALCSALLAGTSMLLAAPNAAAQAGADHSLIWTTGDIVYIDPVLGTPAPATRWGTGATPNLGTILTPYADVSQAVNDMLWNTQATPVFPVVFNVKDGGGLTSYPVPSVGLRIRAHGVKLQTLSNQTIELVGAGTTTSVVILVDTEGPRFFPAPSGLPMPASIIQGFTIREGATGIRMDVQTTSSNDPIRTEVRDCVITENKFAQVFNNRKPPSGPGGTAGGGIGIHIKTLGEHRTQYVIEHNRIFGQGDFFYGEGGPSSWGIFMEVFDTAQDSTLIRGNQIYEQETGIQVRCAQSAWARPRILSNLMWDHEQHIFSEEAGPALFNNTIYRARDYCEGPDRHVVHHAASTHMVAGSDPMLERTAMVVRNCIIEHPDQAVEPGGPPQPPFIPTWPVDTFCGGGDVVLSNSDIGPIIVVFPNNSSSGSVACRLTPLAPPAATGLYDVVGNNFGRSAIFVDASVPDIHLDPTAPQVEDGDANDIEPNITQILVGTDMLPCDVRIDVDGHVRLVDQDRNGTRVPDRGGDEVCLPPQFGMTLTASNADRTGNVVVGAVVNLDIEGMPFDVAFVHGWLDCSSVSTDDVVFNNTNAAPVGNLLLPQTCGVVSSPMIFLDQFGKATFQVALAGPSERQVYFQAFGLTSSTLGTASNRVRIEVN